MIFTYGDIFKATQEQSDAICHKAAPLMIVAGAGTGKTTTLLYRYIYLTENLKIDPENLLVITYTEKAASELTNRLVKKIGKTARKSYISTFHSFCYMLIKEYGKINNQLQFIEESEAIYHILSSFDKLKPFYSDEFPLNPQRAASASLSLINRFRDELLFPENLNTDLLSGSILTKEEINQLKDVRNIFNFYQDLKLQMGLVDYGDMIVQARDILKNNPSVLLNIQNKYRHIIIDEFQDNNYALNEVIGLIANKNYSITVVGDDDQTIYSFRGASKYNLKFFRKSYQSHPYYKETTLNTSFRSHQKILDTANNSIGNNTERIIKTLKAHNKNMGPRPKLIYADMNQHQDIILKSIKENLKKGIPPEEIAVLCRSVNKAKSMLQFLRQAKIPVNNRFIKFFELKPIKTLNSWCQVVGEGTYRESAFFYLLKEKFGVNQAVDIIRPINHKHKRLFFDQILSQNINQPLYRELNSLIKLIKSLQKQSIKKTSGEMLWNICIQTGILRPLTNQYDYFNQLALINIGRLFKKAQHFSKRGYKDRGLKEFNLYIETLMETGGISVQYPTENINPYSVVVSTIHGVKGGEFNTVIIPYNRSGSFPVNFKRESIIKKIPDEWLPYKSHTNLSPREYHHEEERRLFYVALTRAKEQLILLAPTKATSKFIKELDKSLIEEESMEPIKKELNTQISNIGLRDSYEQKLQNALTKDNFDKAEKIINALRVIKDFENGIPFKPNKQEKWAKELISDMDTYSITSKNEELILSATAIETYQKCPLKYRLSFLDRVPESESKPQMAFGSIIHRVLQRYHEPKKELTEDRILRLLDEEWNQDEFDYSAREEKFREQGESILKEYVRRTEHDPPNVLFREHSFEFTLAKNVIIRGKIDRIDEIDGGYNVIDYKTSKTTSKAEKSIQLAIYCLYFEQTTEENIKGTPASSSLYFLRELENPVSTYSFSTDELNIVKDLILETSEKIRSNDFEPKTGFHCNWCDYKHLLCPEWEAKE